MSKQAIVEELQTWLTSETFSPDRERVQEIQNRYTALQQSEEEAALKSHLESGGVADEFEWEETQEDKRFQELLGIYHDKRKQADQKRKQDEAGNLSEKKALITEMQTLIQDEENIGKAYKRFNAIKQKWNEIGPVPNEQRRELQAEYSRLIELFYYNINIYRELQINDLKKNLELKQGIIDKIKLLNDEKSVNQVDFLIHQYLDEWDQIGPTFQEEWDKIRESFKEEIGKVFERIREHRKVVKEEHQKNLDAKEALIGRVKSLADLEMNDPVEVQKRSKEIVNIQKEWKKLGFAGRGKNDKIWKNFRAACDAYFEKRDAFMAASNAELKTIKERKQAIIEKAKAIYQGEDHKQIADALKVLQQDWKRSGKLLPNEEFKLFKEFRSYCDAFFNRKKVEAEAAMKEAKENLEKKEAQLKKMVSSIESDLKKEGEDLIKAWQSEWALIGEVPFKLKDKLDQQFNDLVTKAYRALGVSKEALEAKQFDAKLEVLTQSKKADSALATERSAVLDKIKALQTTLAQEESKLDFFKFSKDNNPLKLELMNRINAVKEEILALKDQKKRLDLAIKGLNDDSGQKSDGGEASNEGEA